MAPLSLTSPSPRGSCQAHQPSEHQNRAQASLLWGALRGLFPSAGLRASTRKQALHALDARATVWSVSLVTVPSQPSLPARDDFPAQGRGRQTQAWLGYKGAEPRERPAPCPHVPLTAQLGGQARGPTPRSSQGGPHRRPCAPNTSGCRSVGVCPVLI